MAGLLEGLRALGSGRVVDDVLELVIDSAIDVTGAERGFIMLANDQGSLEFKLARARGRLTLSGRTFATSRKIPETVFTTGQEAIVEDLLDGDLQLTCTRAPWRSASDTSCAPRCGWSGISSVRKNGLRTRSSACCISTAASVGRCVPRPHGQPSRP